MAPIRTFVSSTLILTPAQQVSENGSSKHATDAPRAPAPPVSEDFSSISARAAHHTVTESPHLPRKEVSESIAPSSVALPSATSDATPTSEMNVDQVTNDIPLTVVAPVEEDGDYLFEH